jgi:hypothetical protein
VATDVVGSTPIINLGSEISVDPEGEPRESSENSSTLDVGILGETALDDMLGSCEAIKTFALRIGKCGALLGAPMKVLTFVKIISAQEFYYLSMVGEVSLRPNLQKRHH